MWRSTTHGEGLPPAMLSLLMKNNALHDLCRQFDQCHVLVLLLRAYQFCHGRSRFSSISVLCRQEPQTCKAFFGGVHASNILVALLTVRRPNVSETASCYKDELQLLFGRHDHEQHTALRCSIADLNSLIESSIATPPPNYPLKRPFRRHSSSKDLVLTPPTPFDSIYLSTAETLD
jgi:hypothetical protein